jgi:hypothetical protein
VKADPSRGTVSYVSPLAQGVLTQGPGETLRAVGERTGLTNNLFDAQTEETLMPNVYVEARPKGRPEGSAIEDYVVEQST